MLPVVIIIRKQLTAQLLTLHIADSKHIPGFYFHDMITSIVLIAAMNKHESPYVKEAGIIATEMLGRDIKREIEATIQAEVKYYLHKPHFSF